MRTQVFLRKPKLINLTPSARPPSQKKKEINVISDLLEQDLVENNFQPGF